MQPQNCQSPDSLTPAQILEFNLLTASIEAMFKNGRLMAAAPLFSAAAVKWVPAAIARFKAMAATGQHLDKMLSDVIVQQQEQDKKFNDLRQVNLDLCQTLANHGIDLTDVQAARIKKLL